MENSKLCVVFMQWGKKENDTVKMTALFRDLK